MAETETPEATQSSEIDVSRKSADQRKQMMAQTVQNQVAQGSRVESQSDYSAVLVKGHRPNHLLHLVLSFFTLGLWLFVWVGIVAFGGEKRSTVQVDEFGNVNVQRL